MVPPSLTEALQKKLEREKKRRDDHASGFIKEVAEGNKEVAEGKGDFSSFNKTALETLPEKPDTKE